LTKQELTGQKKDLALGLTAKGKVRGSAKFG
jgi:hypothetical protein